MFLENVTESWNFYSDITRFSVMSEIGSLVFRFQISGFRIFTVIFFIIYFFQKYRMSDLEDHMQLFDLIGQMLEYDPTDRISLAVAIKHPFFDKIPPHLRLDLHR